jgi:hypothetical protein
MVEALVDNISYNLKLEVLHNLVYEKNWDKLKISYLLGEMRNSIQLQDEKDL